MRDQQPVTAFGIADGKRRQYPSIRELSRKLKISGSYARRKINSGLPCKGYLLFDDIHADTPETKEMLRSVCADFDKHNEEATAKAKRKRDGLVSVRIDSKTVILIKASRWTPDYAERYRAKLHDAQRQAAKYEPSDFVNQNNHLMDKPKRGGRQ